MWKHCIIALACASVAVSHRAEVIINEIHYDPDVKTELVEFIELHNTSPAAVDLSGWQISDAVDFTFPPGSSIPANGYQVICQNAAHFTAKFGAAALGPWTGSLRNEGEEIVLRDAAGNVVDRVDYQLGFPWPTVGEPPGFSIELAHPAFDNSLGGNWRPSGAISGSGDTTIIPAGSSWRFFKGTQEPSVQTGGWRELEFPEVGWLTGTMPIGYDPDINLGTRLNDMPGNYTTVYFRKVFVVDDPSQFAALQIQALYDDGFKVWINGQLVIFPSMPSSEVPFHGTSTGSARESAAYDTFNLPPPGGYLRAGENIIAAQGANVLLSGSSDFFLDLRLVGKAGSGGIGPSPFARNNSFTDNVAPAIRQVDHSPNQPAAGETVRVRAKVTDPEGVAGVQLRYQLVNPGSYIELTDPAYATSWTILDMNDAGTGGDEFAGDSVYTAMLPASIQTHRRLVRYRVTATDATGKSITAPYSDDPVPNFAYFCYNGAPAWSGAISPSSSNTDLARVVTYPEPVMRSLPVYHLISKQSSVEASTWIERYGGDLYKWSGALVFNGKVYDHIHYRARGGVWRYAMGKNMWKFDFNRGHDFEPTDNWGRPYEVGWTKLNLGACIQQGDYAHRGEQGLFESVGFRLFNLAGLEASHSHFVHFRIIDAASETGANQYSGDFWGLYLALEQLDSRFLQEHELPDSNFYKMEGGTGELNNQGQYGVTDKSDLNAFLGAINTSQLESWWRENFDLTRYYNYRAIVEGIHHYDIDGNPGKNYFYYINDATGKWQVHPWDLDLTWADNMYGSGNEQFKSRVLPIGNFSREYKNRVRELRDLLFNTDQAYKLIDEYAAMIYQPGTPSFVDADRAMWDFNPIMASGYVNPSKSGQGRFYQRAATKDFPGMVQIMKSYVLSRGSLLDSQAAESGLPARPTIANISAAGNPANNLRFQSSAYSGSSPFSRMQWRIGEITPPDRPAYDPNEPRKYEIEPVWQSGELTVFNSAIAIPSGVVRVGKTYRARVKMRDSLLRWSNWSAPVEFVAGEPDNASALVQNLRVTELMFHPPQGSDFEFVELFNSNPSLPLDLSGVKFTAGIDFTFPAGSSLAPGEYGLVMRAASASAFRAHYGLPPSAHVFGPYSGSLSNDGEELTLKTTAAGAAIVSFTFGDNGSWPMAADGAGHSIVPLFDHVPQHAGDFSFPGNWRASAFIKGSPGAADPAPLAGPVLNEVMANTVFSDPAFPGYDSNDWIELANPTANAFAWTACYLSDDADNLKKWALPPGSIDANALLVFDEVTGFHSPITAGFGLDQAGEQVFLSHLPGNGQDRVIDAVKFKGQSTAASWGRLPNAAGRWLPVAPTPAAPNGPAVPGLVISEIMHHPPPSGEPPSDNTLDEFVEILNPTVAAINLSSAAGTWRIDGGVNFQFPAGVALDAGATLLLVNFNPAVAASSNSFRAKYSVPEGVKILGPYSGKLGNDSDRVALERPEPPKSAGQPLAWIVVDEVTYGKRPLWPHETDGAGASLHRVAVSDAGNSPSNWRAAPPDPGQAGAAEFRIASAEIQAGTLTLRLFASAGKTYALERCDDLQAPNWSVVRTIGPVVTSTWLDAVDPDPAADGMRFYRVRLEP